MPAIGEKFVDKLEETESELASFVQILSDMFSEGIFDRIFPDKSEEAVSNPNGKDKQKMILFASQFRQGVVKILKYYQTKYPDTFFDDINDSKMSGLWHDFWANLWRLETASRPIRGKILGTRNSWLFMRVFVGRWYAKVKQILSYASAEVKTYQYIKTYGYTGEKQAVSDIVKMYHTRQKSNFYLNPKFA